MGSPAPSSAIPSISGAILPSGRRLSAALGPGADPRVVRVLETTFSGALLTAGMGHMSSTDIPEFVAGAADLMTGPTP